MKHPRVIRRTFDPDGGGNHQDDATTFEEAEACAGHRLDRRRRYAIISGEVCSMVTWSGPCSGCHDYFCPPDSGAGCDECGHTGRRRHCQWVPTEHGGNDDER